MNKFMNWVFVTHYRISFPLLVFVAITPIFLDMAEDGASPYDLTILAIWFIMIISALIKQNTRVNSIIKSQQKAMEDMFAHSQRLKEKIRESDPELHDRMSKLAEKLQKENDI